jgi:5,10-methylenetetrahydrofolate reductase
MEPRTLLATSEEWLDIAEVNPPVLPSARHLMLDHAWRHVLITDNAFGKIRVSPYAFAARITHDVPSVTPTVVVSTRDRNILAIESEVRGALGNGVSSFLVVVGDTLPQVEHMAHHYEIVEHLRDLQGRLPHFEVGMTTRFRDWQFRRRVEAGAEFFVAGPVLDPETVGPSMERLRRRPQDPPVYVMIIPPFSQRWVERMEGVGSVPVSDRLREELSGGIERERAWELALQSARVARDEGFGGGILTGLKFDTVVDEGAGAWRRL